MAEKGETKIVAIVTICVILLSISFSGCFEEEKEDDYCGTFTYKLQFFPENNDVEYTLIIPFPVHEGNINQYNQLLFFNFKINISSAEIEKTLFGLGLNISYQSQIDIIFKGDSNKDMDRYYPSLKNGSYLRGDGEYMIYSNINGTFYYGFEIYHNDGTGIGHIIYPTNLKIGWNIVNGYADFYENGG
jgi:hypothetical protein